MNLKQTSVMRRVFPYNACSFSQSFSMFAPGRCPDVAFVPEKSG